MYPDPIAAGMRDLAFLGFLVLVIVLAYEVSLVGYIVGLALLLILVLGLLSTFVLGLIKARRAVIQAIGAYRRWRSS